MKGVLFLYMGAPDSPEAIQPFLYNLFSDDAIISMPMNKLMAFVISRLRARKVKRRYELIGGASPLLKITSEQAEALEKRLGVPVYVGMRYWKPFINEALDRVLKAGIDKLVVLPLYPQYSSTTTGSAFSELSLAQRNRKQKLVITKIKSWQRNELFIEALAEKTEAALNNFEAEIIFSAHSLPVSIIEKGDPYQKQVKETVEALESRLGVKGTIAYQSSGPGRWLKPEIKEVITSMASEGKKKVLVAPVSFVSDHIETLYDIDIAMKKYAGKLGIELRRTEALNTSESFIRALEKIVRDSL
ncbi:MAG TPA: ferrochelatase [Euryarchaeota archaeon]|nr:ferrochelatase [archaeon BMS3Bbin15]HDL14695.1 ferrochelatase [Euryarchaeota archaeon]